jgi:hypothetical protein
LLSYHFEISARAGRPLFRPLNLLLSAHQDAGSVLTIFVGRNVRTRACIIGHAVD